MVQPGLRRRLTIGFGILPVLFFFQNCDGKFSPSDQIQQSVQSSTSSSSSTSTPAPSPSPAPAPTPTPNPAPAPAPMPAPAPAPVPAPMPAPMPAPAPNFGIGGPSLCGQGSFTLCESFEGGVLPSNWPIRAGDISVGTPPIPGRGSKALHARHKGLGEAILGTTQGYPFKDNSYYGRLFVYFANSWTEQYSHWAFAADLNGPNYIEWKMGGLNYATLHRVWGVGSVVGGDWTISDTDTPANQIATGRWICIEWSRDGINNTSHFWVDGVEHPGVATSPIVPAPNSNGRNGDMLTLPKFTQLQVGIEEYWDTNQSYDVWIDEIATSPTRIGCDK